MVSEGVGRRDRKRLQTHAALRNAALQLSADRGLDKVTVEDIAEAADVSIRTFYAHFPSKEDAIVGFDSSRVEVLRHALLERPANEPPLESLRYVLYQLHVESRDEWPLRMRVIKKNPDLLARMFASFAVFERAMVEAIAQRTQTDAVADLYPALVTAVAAGAFRAVISAWRGGGEKIAFDDLFDSAFTQLGDSLRVPEKSMGRVTPGLSKSSKGGRA